MTHPNDEELVRALKMLAELLQHPEPGIMSWITLRNDQAKTIYNELLKRGIMNA